MANMIFKMEGSVSGFGDKGSTTNYRICARTPLKSSVVGLLSAACGYKRKDSRIQELSDKVDIKVTNLSDSELFVDFQTVNGRRSNVYDKNGKKVQVGMKNASSGVNTSSILINKEYRCGELSYLVEVESDEETIDMLKEAIRHPRYFLYLGKKNCPAKVYLLEDIRCRQEEQ